MDRNERGSWIVCSGGVVQHRRVAHLVDRIVVMTFRPSTIRRDVRVELPRLRDLSSAAFNALKRELDELVMTEQYRREEAERHADG